MPGAGRTEPAPPPGRTLPGRRLVRRLLIPPLHLTARLVTALLVIALLFTLLLSAVPAPAVLAEDPGRELLLTGTVVESDPSSRYPDPLANALVELLPVPDPYRTAITRLDGEEVQPVAATRSDAEGRYRLTAPEAGLWNLRVSAPGRHLERTLIAYLPEEMHPPLAIPERRRLTVRVEDPAGAPVTGAWIAAASVADGDANDEAALPARVRALVRARGRTAASGSRETPEVFGRTGDDGRVTLTLPSAGPLRLTALAPEFAPATVEVGGTETRGSEVRVALRDGLRRPVRVRDAAERPVAGAVVLLGEPAVPVGRTGENGALEVLAPDGEALAVRALAPDLRSASAALEPSEPPEEPESESDRAPVAPLVLELEEPPVLTGQVVEDGSRAPLAGAVVWAPDAGQAVTTSGPRGGYSLRLPVTPPRTFRLVALLSGYLPRWLTVEPRQVVSAGGRDPLPTLALEPAAAVAGTVVDSEGEPVPDVDVLVATRSDRRRGGSLTAADGRFFVAPLEPGGATRLHAEKKGYAPTTVDLPPLEPRQTIRDVRVVLLPGRTAFGRVVTAEEEPVAGAEVWLLPQPRGSSRMDRFLQRRLILEHDPTRTDAGGAFRLEDLAEGVYNLRVEASGFAPAEVPGLEIAAGGGPLDLGTVVVEAAVRVTGRVVDPDERPVDGVRIQAFSQGSVSWGGRRSELFEATTDTDGRFAVGDLRRGERVTLLAEKPGYAEARVRGVEVPSEEPVEIVLQPAARVSGTVRNPQGRPVEDAQVRVDASGGRGWWGGRSEPARTDAEGRFTLTDVSPGDVTLHAYAEGYLRDGLVHLQVEPGAHLEDVEITLTPGATVLGRVVGPAGEPLPEARVSLLEESRRFGTGGSAYTDGDGRYRLEGVPPGARTFLAAHEDHPQETRDLEVSSGDNRLDFRLSLGQEVSGRVVDSSGSPVAGAAVWLNGLSPGESRNGTSGSDGGFRFTGLANGRYRLLARHPDHGDAALEEPLELRGSGRSGLELRFEGAGVIRGRVVGLSLDELTELEIRAFNPEGGNRGARPDFEGRFRLEGLRPGTWTLLAAGPDGRQVSEEVELPEGAPEAYVELELQAGFTLTGQVLVGSEPLDNGTVHVRKDGGIGGGYTSLDHQGRFRIEGLEEGTYRLRLFSQRGLNHQREVEISGDRELLIELEAASLSGRVVDASTGEPLAGVEVEMSPAEDETSLAGVFGAVRTDATGLFRIRDLTAGRYRVAFSKEGYGRAERPVDLAAGTADSIEVRLEPSRGLVLQLRWAAGLLPASWVQVTARSPEGRTGVSGGFPVGETGAVRLKSLPPGSWEIRVTAHGAAVTTVQAVAPGPPVPVDLGPEARLEVTVPELLDETGTVATVEVLGPDGRPLPLLGTRSSVTLRSGRTTLDQLPAGTWTVRATAADGRVWSAPATTRAGATGRLVLE